MHHYHVKHPGTSHYFEVHGDYDTNDDGGYFSYNRTIPGGGCAVMDERGDMMWLQVQINDVRNSKTGGAMGTIADVNATRAVTVAGDVALEPLEW
jgi:hypothetical protein